MLARVKEVVKTLDHPLRLKLYAVLLTGEFSEEDLAEMFDREVLHISLHLKHLEKLRLVECDSNTSDTLYQACPNPIEAVRRCVRDRMGDEKDFWRWLRNRRVSTGVHRPRGF